MGSGGMLKTRRTMQEKIQLMEEIKEIKSQTKKNHTVSLVVSSDKVLPTSLRVHSSVLSGALVVSGGTTRGILNC